jgi:hypothetical protein
VGHYPFSPVAGDLTLPVPVADGGTGQVTAAAAFAALAPPGSAGEVLGVSDGVPAYEAGMTLLASTGASGSALANGTGVILTWTAPNDGNLHRIILTGALNVTVNETGGQIGVHYTDVSGSAQDQVLLSGALTTGVTNFNNVGRQLLMIKPGVTVSINQDSALPAGAAVLFAEIWGS